MGFKEIRRIYSRPVAFEDNPKIKAQIGDIKFASMTVRIFKSTGLTDTNLDHGETATYEGGIPDKEDGLIFDEHYYFPKGEPISVCSNTAQILRTSRFGKYFSISEKGALIGDHAIQTGTGDFYVATDSSKEGAKVEVAAGCCVTNEEEEGSNGCCTGTVEPEEEKGGCCGPTEGDKPCCPPAQDAEDCCEDECCPPAKEEDDCCEESCCPPKKESCCPPKEESCCPPKEESCCSTQKKCC